MKTILIVMTGGTIGSSNKNGIISVSESSCTAIEMYNKKYGNDVCFRIHRVLNILSENLNKHYWEIIVNYILSENLSDYDGIIITHGSDTLSYSSAMLSMCLCSIQKPIIITAANLIPEHPESNAVENIRAAVLLIELFKKCVLTVYRNPGDDYCSVFMPTRLHEADRFLDRFTSIDGKPFGIVKNDHFTCLSDNPEQNSLISHTNKLSLKLPLKLEKDILMIRAYPSLRYDLIKLDNNIGAVLHITYHSSTACSDNDNSVLTLISECERYGIKLYMCSFKSSGNPIYESTDTLIKAGAVPLPHMSDESAYSKLLLSCNLPESRHELINKNLYFEIL